VDDGAQGFDFSGIYRVDLVDQCNRYIRDTSPTAYLSATSCADGLWALGAGGTSLPAIAQTNFASLPYEGQYGPGGTSGLPVVSAVIGRSIPANTWIVSDYPDLSTLAAAWGTGCDAGPFFVNGLATPPGSYAANTSCGSSCAFTLVEYHYPSPSCYRVAVVASAPPSVSMAGDYTIGSPPVYYPDDDDDRAVFNGPTNLLFYYNGRWRIGPATGADCCYQSVATTQRTPNVGLYTGIDDPAGTYTGKHRVVLCGNGQGWFPWCCTPCPVGVVSCPNSDIPIPAYLSIKIVGASVNGVCTGCGSSPAPPTSPIVLPFFSGSVNNRCIYCGDSGDVRVWLRKTVIMGIPYIDIIVHVHTPVDPNCGLYSTFPFVWRGYLNLIDDPFKSWVNKLQSLQVPWSWSVDPFCDCYKDGYAEITAVSGQ